MTPPVPPPPVSLPLEDGWKLATAIVTGWDPTNPKVAAMLICEALQDEQLAIDTFCSLAGIVQTLIGMMAMTPGNPADPLSELSESRMRLFGF